MIRTKFKSNKSKSEQRSIQTKIKFEQKSSLNKNQVWTKIKFEQKSSLNKNQVEQKSSRTKIDSNKDQSTYEWLDKLWCCSSEYSRLQQRRHPCNRLIQKSFSHLNQTLHPIIIQLNCNITSLKSNITVIVVKIGFEF